MMFLFRLIVTLVFFFCLIVLIPCSGLDLENLPKSSNFDADFCFGPAFSNPQLHTMSFHKHMCISDGKRYLHGVIRNTSLEFDSTKTYHSGTLIYWNHTGTIGNPIHDLSNFIAPFVYFMENCIQGKIPGVQHFILDPIRHSYNNSKNSFDSRQVRGCYIPYIHRLTIVWAKCVTYGILKEYITPHQSLFNEEGCYKNVFYVESKYSGMFNPLRSKTEDKLVPFKWPFIPNYTDEIANGMSPDQLRINSRIKLAPFHTYLPINKLRDTSLQFFQFLAPVPFRGAENRHTRPIRILIFSRLPTRVDFERRGWMNVNETINHLESILVPDSVVMTHVGSMITTPFYDQMELLVDTDIVITAHGGHLGNLVFLKPGAAVLISRKMCYVSKLENDAHILMNCRRLPQTCLKISETDRGAQPTEDYAEVQDQWFAWMQNVFDFKWVLMRSCTQLPGRRENFVIDPKVVEDHLRRLNLPSLNFRQG